VAEFTRMNIQEGDDDILRGFRKKVLIPRGASSPIAVNEEETPQTWMEGVRHVKKMEYRNDEKREKIILEALQDWEKRSGGLQSFDRLKTALWKESSGKKLEIALLKKQHSSSDAVTFLRKTKEQFKEKRSKSFGGRDQVVFRQPPMRYRYPAPETLRNPLRKHLKTKKRSDSCGKAKTTFSSEEAMKNEKEEVGNGDVFKLPKSKGLPLPGASLPSGSFHLP